MSDFDQQFRVWTLSQAPKGRYRKRLETGDLDQALQHANSLASGGEWSCVSELGAFQHKAGRVVGWVTFWWCAALNGEMDGAPQGRGSGWYDDEDEWVSYQYPGAEQSAPRPGAASTSVPVVHLGWPSQEVRPVAETDSHPYGGHHRIEPGRRYIEATCDDCGVILPMNQLMVIDREVMSARTSGTKRASYSHSSGGHSRSGTSVTSGRQYYEVQQVALCHDCHGRELERQRRTRPILIQLAEYVIKAITRT